MSKRSQQEKLARIVCRLHLRTLYPFWMSNGLTWMLDENTGNYGVKEDSSYTWNRLQEESPDPSRIDKRWFRAIAAHVLKEVESVKDECERIEKLARIVRAILFGTLVPFFPEDYAKSVLEERTYREWDDLPEYSHNPFLSHDKMFYKAVAVHVLAAIGMYKKSHVDAKGGEEDKLAQEAEAWLDRDNLA